MEYKTEKNSKKPKNILYIAFNQDYSCISIGTEEGYIIYNSSPFKEICKRSNYIYIL
jgi:autophagy-related protein 18